MDTVLRILQAAGGWNHGLHLNIENPPYKPLVIEALDESGPCGLPALSVCRYSEVNGDLMRDPELCFELGFAGKPHLSVFYYRNDFLGIEQWSRFIRNASYCLHPAWFEQHQELARLWNKALEQQRFAEVFDPHKHICA